MKKGVQLLGSLSNRNKRIVGQKYGIQRFSIGDQLKHELGPVGTVAARGTDTSTVRWESGDFEVIPWSNPGQFTFVKEVPPR